MKALIRRELAAFTNQVTTMETMVENMRVGFNAVTSHQRTVVQSIMNVSASMDFYTQLLSHVNYDKLQTDTALTEVNKITTNITGSSSQAFKEWGVTSQFIPWYGGHSVCDILETLAIRVKGLKELLERRTEVYVGGRESEEKRTR